MQPKKPRVALIGLSAEQNALLTPLCGEARSADTWNTYRINYALSETDVAVVNRWDSLQPGVPVHSMALAPQSIGYERTSGARHSYFEVALETVAHYTERQVSVAAEPPRVYEALASELTKHLQGLGRPPHVLRRPSDEFLEAEPIVRTTSGHPVVLRHLIEPPPGPQFENAVPTVLLALAECPDLAVWFRAFLADVHEIDPERVPHPPPRLAMPEDWYTPEERRAAAHLHAIAAERDRLDREEADRSVELVDAGELADAGPRRAIWEDGKKLEAAIEDILREFGFDVRNMDAVTPAGAPKREDLRLTHPDLAGWEALVEVKGYSGGTRTNDAQQQITRFQKNYIQEAQRQPNLTLWVANTHRHSDPSARPAPDDNVRTAAANIDAVHVQATDLYRLWALVADGRLDPADVVTELSSATPGLWEPSALD